jgi:predicted N-acetyltransferase YhbS
MSDLLNLPRDLGDGLVLRWATAEDTEALAAFNFKHHDDSPAGQPEKWLMDWTRDLLVGSHPTTGPQDVTVVVDEHDGGRIVSAVFLISQTWRYEEVAFGCGMPELIATDENYRRRGLVRLQMDVVHALSEKKGELVQVIGGIPWYYRQFGYDMAIDMGGGLRVPLAAVEPLSDDKEEPYRLREVVAADIPALKSLYEILCGYSMLSCLRDDRIWYYEIELDAGREFGMRHLEIIETAEGQIIGYIGLQTFPTPNRFQELAVNPGCSLHAVCQFLNRALKARIEKLNIENKPTNLYYSLGKSHPAYEVLGKDSGQWRRPYAWYVRVPDLARFLLHIRPVLERRLAESVMTGYSGSLKLNFYTRQLKIDIKKGNITAVKPYKPNDFFDFDVYFPDLTFYHVLFGRRDIEELGHIFTDCYPRNDESALLLKSLFPKKSSDVIRVE